MSEVTFDQKMACGSQMFAARMQNKTVVLKVHFGGYLTISNIRTIILLK